MVGGELVWGWSVALKIPRWWVWDVDQPAWPHYAAGHGHAGVQGERGQEQAVRGEAADPVQTHMQLSCCCWPPWLPRAPRIPQTQLLLLLLRLLLHALLQPCQALLQGWLLGGWERDRALVLPAALPALPLPGLRGLIPGLQPGLPPLLPRHCRAG